MSVLDEVEPEGLDGVEVVGAPAGPPSVDQCRRRYVRARRGQINQLDQQVDLRQGGVTPPGGRSGVATTAGCRRRRAIARPIRGIVPIAVLRSGDGAGARGGLAAATRSAPSGAAASARGKGLAAAGRASAWPCCPAAPAVQGGDVQPGGQRGVQELRQGLRLTHPGRERLAPSLRTRVSGSSPPAGTGTGPARPSRSCGRVAFSAFHAASPPRPVAVEAEHDLRGGLEQAVEVLAGGRRSGGSHTALRMPCWARRSRHVALDDDQALRSSRAPLGLVEAVQLPALVKDRRLRRVQRTWAWRPPSTRPPKPMTRPATVADREHHPVAEPVR